MYVLPPTSLPPTSMSFSTSPRYQLSFTGLFDNMYTIIAPLTSSCVSQLAKYKIKSKSPVKEVCDQTCAAFHRAEVGRHLIADTIEPPSWWSNVCVLAVDTILATILNRGGRSLRVAERTQIVYRRCALNLVQLMAVFLHFHDGK